MSYYQKHVFMCVNQKEGGRKCCQDAQASELQAYAKTRVQALGLHGPARIRINRSGCLGRCSEGPALVIYPEGIWYTYRSQADLDEIIEQHLLQGNIVQRLLLPKPGA